MNTKVIGSFLREPVPAVIPSFILISSTVGFRSNAPKRISIKIQKLRNDDYRSVNLRYRSICIFKHDTCGIFNCLVPTIKPALSISVSVIFNPITLEFGSMTPSSTFSVTICTAFLICGAKRIEICIIPLI